MFLSLQLSSLFNSCVFCISIIFLSNERCGREVDVLFSFFCFLFFFFCATQLKNSTMDGSINFES